jgi:ketosteroid isomerase-like protein
MLLVVACGKKAEQSVIDIETDIAAIELLTCQRVRVFNESNLDAFMALVTDDAVFMPLGVQPLIGKEAIYKWQKFDDKSFDATIFSDEIEICGEWAFQRVHWEGSWTINASGDTTPYKSKEIFIYRRQPDGSWLTTHAIWNGTPIEIEDK